MKKELFLLIIALSLGVTELRAQNWNLVETFDFNSGPLNTSVWHTYYNYGYQSCIYPNPWLPPPCRIHGSVPSISELETYEDDCISFTTIGTRQCLSLDTYNNFPHIENCSSYNYKSGMIYSDATYLYGKFEICCKVPNGKGFHPAFWLWDQAREIDCFEPKLDITPSGINRVTNTMDFNYHRNNIDYNAGTSFTNDVCYSLDFHIYSIEWTNNYIKWYIDNQLRWMVHSSAPYFPEVSLHIIASLAIDGVKNGIDYSPDSGTTFPNSFLIDYIKVYEEECPSYVLCDSDMLGSYSGYDIDLAIPLDVDYNGINENTWAGGDLTCQKTVTTSLTVNAENCITLNCGFSVEIGAEFSANILPCAK